MKVVYRGNKRNVLAGTKVLMRNERTEISEEEYEQLGRNKRHVTVVSPPVHSPVQQVRVDEKPLKQEPVVIEAEAQITNEEEPEKEEPKSEYDQEQ